MSRMRYSLAIEPSPSKVGLDEEMVWTNNLEYMLVVTRHVSERYSIAPCILFTRIKVYFTR